MKAGDNPFRVSRIHALSYRWPPGISPENLTRRWEQTGYRAALVAPHGHGKSTLLHEWSRYLKEQGWSVHQLTLTREHPCVPVSFLKELRQEKFPCCVLLDGAEQLRYPAWKRWEWITRHADGRVITQHRPGRWDTLLHLQSDAPLLRGLLEELLAGDLRKLPASPETLHAQHHGNLREIFSFLYDQWT